MFNNGSAFKPYAFAHRAEDFKIVEENSPSSYYIVEKNLMEAVLCDFRDGLNHGFVMWLALYSMCKESAEDVHISQEQMATRFGLRKPISSYPIEVLKKYGYVKLIDEKAKRYLFSPDAFGALWARKKVHDYMMIHRLNQLKKHEAKQERELTRFQLGTEYDRERLLKGLDELEKRG